MKQLTRVGDIDVWQDLPAERRAYRVRRLFVAVFGLILVAAPLGLLRRSGPLSDTTRSAGLELVVGYERFQRPKTTTQLDVLNRRGRGRDEHRHLA